MVNVNLKLYYLGKRISLIDAINEGLAEVEESGLRFSEKIEVISSTELYDKDGSEIYQGDTLVGNDGRKYIVEKIKGTYFIRAISDKQGGLCATLSGLKLGNHINNMKLEIK